MYRLLMGCLLFITFCILVMSPVLAAGWTAEANVLDLIAGPGNRAAYLAPDGSQFMYFSNREMCLHTLDGEKGNCIGLEDGISIDVESIRWSPDSTKVAFSENFFITFRDSDIWMWDVEANTLVDVTPAANRKLDLFGNDNPNITFTVDVSPQWSADSETIYFIRYQFQNSGDAHPAFYRISLKGDEAEEVAKVKTNVALSTYGFGLSPDGTQIAYNLDTRGDERDGTWLLNVKSGEATFAAAAIEGTLPWTYQFSPRGDLALVVGSSMKFGNFADGMTPADSAIYTLSTSGGRQQQLDVDHFVFGAGWAPEGSALAYVTFDREDEDGQGLYITSAPGQKGEMVLEGRYIPPTPQSRSPIVWAASNTLLLSQLPDFKLVVVHLKQG